ncbi:hypothetical protein [Caulobacter endophyticus]|uniref:hypothetical protein n=1 Tax=Caulobacter endophyticus TaxID=2172652 RepID=UPI00240EFBD5|nr:hypothetical protein [Caulobacter endophyticus]MDG2531022.1 hypothetical protein [Caulobacter endophyticus]
MTANETMKSEPAPARQTRLTPAQWAQAKALLETGQMTKAGLARKFGISRQSMSEGMNKRGAIYGSRCHVVEEACIEGLKDDAARRAEEIVALREKQLKATELLHRLQMKAMADAVRDDRPLSSLLSEAAAISLLIKNQRLIRQQLWGLYGLRDQPATADTVEFVVSERPAASIGDRHA